MHPVYAPVGAVEWAVGLQTPIQLSHENWRDL